MIHAQDTYVTDKTLCGLEYPFTVNTVAACYTLPTFVVFMDKERNKQGPERELCETCIAHPDVVLYRLASLNEEKPQYSFKDSVTITALIANKCARCGSYKACQCASRKKNK